MKLFLNSFVFLLIFCGPLLGEGIKKTYVVKVGGIKIGELNWEVEIGEIKYFNKLDLKSKGLLSTIYNFKGEYFSEGLKHNNELVPKKYTHFWQTKKTTKKMELIFNQDKLVTLKQSPAEMEKIRLNIFVVQKTNDPLTSFLKIMIGKKNALVVDGRRLYTMTADTDASEKATTIEISNYLNLWADHRKNKFEKIIFEKNKKDLLPSKLSIYFDGKIFRLSEI